MSSAPLAVRVGSNGLAVLFRYGVAVFIGLSVTEEAEFLEKLSARCFGKITPPEEEWAKIQVAKEAEEPIPVGGPILVREFSLERLLVVSDALAKSVVLGRDEREVDQRIRHGSSRSRANSPRSAKRRETGPTFSS